MGKLNSLNSTQAPQAEGERASQYARSLIEASLDPLVTISPLRNADSRTDLGLRIRLSIGKKASDAPNLGLAK